MGLTGWLRRATPKPTIAKNEAIAAIRYGLNSREKKAIIIPPANLAITSLIQKNLWMLGPNSGAPIAKATVGASNRKAVQEPTTIKVLMRRQ